MLGFTMGVFFTLSFEFILICFIAFYDGGKKK